MRQVIRWRPLVSPRDRTQPDPTRWLPADFTPSANRHVVQRRPNLRRLPRWKRPGQVAGGIDAIGLAAGRSCERRACSAPTPTSRALGRADRAAMARPLRHRRRERCGAASGRRSRGARSTTSSNDSSSAAKCGAATSCAGSPARSSRCPRRSRCCDRIGDAGRRRADRHDGERSGERVVAAAHAAGPARDAFVRPRSRSALLVTIEGVVVLIAERRGARVVIRPDTRTSSVTRAARRSSRTSSIARAAISTVETIDGQPAGGSTASRRLRRRRLQARHIGPSLLPAASSQLRPFIGADPQLAARDIPVASNRASA